MKTSLTAALLALAAPLAARGQEAPSPWVETRFHRVHLRNGNFIDGHLLQQTQKSLVLHMQRSGEFIVRRDMIERVEFMKMRSLRETPPPPVLKAEEKPEPKKEEVVKTPAPASPVDTSKEPAPSALASRYPAETRAAVDRLLWEHSVAVSTLKNDLEPGLRALGADALGYAGLVARSQKKGVDHPALLEALSKIGGAEATATLAEVLRTATSPESRSAALQGLLRLGDVEALAAAHRAVDDPSAQVRRAAAEAVLKLAEKGLADEEILIGMLDSSRDKNAVAQVLGKLGSEAALDALRALLRDGETMDKIAALQALGKSRDAEDGAYARDLLEAEDEFLRKEACLFLGRIKHGPAASDLIDLLADDSASVSGSALWSLRQITGETFGPDLNLWKTWWERAGRQAFGGRSED